MDNRTLAFWFLSMYCGETLLSLERLNRNNRIERVCYDYINKGCKSRDDYEFLVENFRIFQKIKKDNWIIVELLK